MIILVAAVAKNNVIGNKGKLPWHIPEDLKRFKEITNGKAVLMGRKTFESIIGYLGKPLPNRENIVITRKEDYKKTLSPELFESERLVEGVQIYSSVEEALQKHKTEDIYVIGGAETYAQTIGLADKLYITEVHQEIEGDAVFPEIQTAVWQESARENHEKYSFVEYKKK
ncbi:MAG: dihydrofolate reductase [Patescibacteria group bacterium]